MNNWLSKFFAETPEQGRNAVRLASIFIVAASLAVVVFVYAAVQTGLWQAYATAASFAGFFALDALAIRHARRGRSNTAGILLLVSVCYIVLSMISFMAGIGLGLSIALAVVIVEIVFETLSGSLATRARFLGLAFSVAMFLMDRFAPWERPLLPVVQYAVPALATGTVLVIAYLMVGRVQFLKGALANVSMSWKMAIMVAVLVLGTAGGVATGVSSLTTMRYHLGNIYDFMLIPIVTISNAEARLAENQFFIQEIHTEEHGEGDLEQRILDLRTNDEFVAGVIARYQNEWVTTTSPEFTQLLQDAGRLDLQQQEVAVLDELVTTFNEYNEINEQFLSSLERGQPNKELAHEANEKLQVAVDGLRALIEINNGFAAISNDAAQGAYRQANENMTLVLAISLALGIFLSLLIVSSVTGRLGDLTQSASALQQGNFDQTISVTGQDEVGFLGSTFNAMAGQLKDLFNSLEQRVAARTRDLQAVAEVVTATSTILESKSLLQEVVDLTKERFDLYHSHIYLLDETGRNLVLTAGAGEPGRVMAAEGRSIPVDREQSLVARAARERKGVTVNDVTLAPDFLPNPLLPDTRSEMAVPMIVGGNLIGVFDIQSEKVGRFTDSDVNIQTTLAAQLATSIQNVQSFEQSRKQAEFEAQVNLIGQSIQRATTIEETLQTAIRELGRVMGAPRVLVNIQARPDGNDDIHGM